MKVIFNMFGEPQGGLMELIIVVVVAGLLIAISALAGEYHQGRS